jgi:hypothetical protein
MILEKATEKYCKKAKTAFSPKTAAFLGCLGLQTEAPAPLQAARKEAPSLGVVFPRSSLRPTVAQCLEAPLGAAALAGAVAAAASEGRVLAVWEKAGL